MTDMPAAVVTAFDSPPEYAEFPVPDLTDGAELVDVLAAGLHPRVRSGARGAHYSSSGTLPMVPGVDGVGRRADGRLVYFSAADDAVGSMAARALATPGRCITLPDGADATVIAAAMNPAMSSWVGLRRRVALAPGASVLVLGATGNAGTMAVQVARRLGAARVVAAGRDRARLDALLELGADAVVALGEDAALAAEAAMATLLSARADSTRTLHWLQIGAITGPTLELPSALVRQADLRILGSGQGSVGPADYLAELPSLVEELCAGRLVVTPRPMPLSAVTEAWTTPDVPGERIVLVP